MTRGQFKQARQKTASAVDVSVSQSCQVYARDRERGDRDLWDESLSTVMQRSREAALYWESRVEPKRKVACERRANDRNYEQTLGVNIWGGRLVADLHDCTD